jgi:hypothetical protein
MVEALTSVLGLFSAFIFLAHAVDAYFTARAAQGWRDGLAWRMHRVSGAGTSKSAQTRPPALIIW